LQTLQLPGHIHVCRAGGGIVFLDTRNDRYFGLSGKHIETLMEILLDGHETGAPRNTDSTSLPEDTQQLIRTLIERGLLTQGDSIGSSRSRISVPALEMIPPRLTTDSSRHARARDWASFIFACLRAAWVLKYRSLEWIESEIRSKRETRPAPTNSQDATALELAHVFQRIRRFFYSEKNRCLFNALALMYFLRCYGHFPFWVIGVKATPFAAHSWVQQGRTVLDGDPTLICHFVPILAA